MKTLVYMHLLKLTSQKHFRIKRCVFVGIIIAIFSIILFQKQASWSTLSRGSTLGKSIIDVVTIMLALITFFLLPYFVLKSFSDDEEQREMELLVLTNNAVNIILSKYLAMYLNIFLCGIATLPIAILCLSLGGISVETICFRYLCFFVAVFFVMNLSFYIYSFPAGVFSERLGLYIGFCIILSLLLTCLLGILSILLRHNNFFWKEGVACTMVIVGSLGAFYSARIHLQAKIKFITDALQMKEPDIASAKLDVVPEQEVLQNTNIKQSIREPLYDTERIIRWKDKVFFDGLTELVSFAISLFVLIFFFNSFLHHDTKVFQLVLLCINMIILTILIFTNFSTLFSKEHKHMELLLLTKLKPEDIVGQKLLLLKDNVQWPIFCVAIIFLSTIFVYSKPKPTPHVFYIVLAVFIVTSGICTIFFGIFLSVRQPKVASGLLKILLCMFFLFYVCRIFLGFIVFGGDNVTNYRAIFLSISLPIFLLAVSYYFYKLTIAQVRKNVFKN